MLAAFCLRLSLGLVAFLPLLPADKMHPRFFRTQFLTALGLSIVALLLGWESSSWQCWSLIAAVVVSLTGSLIWTLEPPPLGRLIGLLATAVFAVGAAMFASMKMDWLPWIDAITSGLLVGAYSGATIGAALGALTPRWHRLVDRELPITAHLEPAQP